MGGSPPIVDNDYNDSFEDPEENNLDEKAKEAQERVKYDVLAQELDSLKNKFMNEYKTTIKNNENRIPWYYNDHSEEHVKRVLKNINNVERDFQDISLLSTELKGDALTKYDKSILRTTGILHDIGRGEKPEKGHSLQSEQDILGMKEIIKDKESRELIAKLAKLHNREGIKSLGGKNLKDLVKKNKITQKEAYQARILSISDALDSGKPRVEKNTQGEFRESVIKKINDNPDFSKIDKSKFKEHWEGHFGFSSPKMTNHNNHIGLEIPLDLNNLNNNSSVAARISDLTRSITKDSLTNSDKNQIYLTLKSSSRQKATTWYNKNKFILTQYVDENHVNILEE